MIAVVGLAVTLHFAAAAPRPRAAAPAPAPPLAKEMQNDAH